MAARVIEPYIRTNAARKKRLIDFQTGKADLQPEHKAWLNEVLQFISLTTYFYIDIIGYASKIGDAAFNERLSYSRASAVVRYLEARNNNISPRVRHFRARG